MNEIRCLQFGQTEHRWAIANERNLSASINNQTKKEEQWFIELNDLYYLQVQPMEQREQYFFPFRLVNEYE
jgi:hypothetical protein